MYRKFTAQFQDTDWFGQIYNLFGEVRRKAKSFSEKDIDETIDKAIKAVRKSQ